MSDRDDELRAFYLAHRVDDQLRFYRSRRELFDRAAGQALAVSATLLGFSSAASALAGADAGWSALWAALATILPAASTALSAFTGLYAFEQQSKIYGDAVRALQAAARPAVAVDAEAVPSGPDVGALVERVEAALRQEQAQWGQLTGEIELGGATKG